MGRRLRNAPGLPDSPECVYAKKKTARWLFNLLESGLRPESEFFKCLEWITDCLLKILGQIKDALRKMPDFSKSKVHEDLRTIIKRGTRHYNFFDELIALMEMYPFLEKMMID